MKSYYDHLTTRLEFGEKTVDTRKPIFRSSGIFPVKKNHYINTNILFLGYWHLKRNITEISSVVTLRNKDGKSIKQTFLPIKEPKSYSIKLSEYLENTDFENQSDFLGSLEVEFYSVQDLVYPYPALVLNYFNDNFNTSVHTLERIYNNLDDMMENDAFEVPESGFDIHSTDDISSFLSFVNGPLENDNVKLDYTIINHESKKSYGSINLGRVKPYQTIWLQLDDYIKNLSDFLSKESGAISVKHNLKGFYPRFLVGNIQKKSSSMSFTHTYYDCSEQKTNTDYWNRIDENYYDSSVYVPLFLNDDFFTDVIIYPNFSPSKFNIGFELFDQNGNSLEKFSDILSIDTSNPKLEKINFKEILKNYEFNSEMIYGVHLISNSIDNKIPSRLKYGLNVGNAGKNFTLPTNICFNSKNSNPSLELKPGSFHWNPIFDNGNAIITLGNFSPKKNYTVPSETIMTFYNESNTNNIQKNIIIPPNGNFRFELKNNPDVKSFLNKSDGWVTIKSNNPNVQGFYFNFYDSGPIAGDHFF